jgi:hypothetical protein
MAPLSHTPLTKTLRRLLGSVLSLALPLAFAGCGLWCVVTERAYHLGKSRSGWVDGPVAINDGWAYFAIGVYATVRVAMSEHPRFKRFGTVFDWICVVALALIVFSR